MNRKSPFTIPAPNITSFVLGMFHAAAGSAQEVTPKDLEEQARQFTRTAQMVPMRDGVKLYTTIYVPKERKDPLPFIMNRTPYGIESRGPKALKDYLKDLADEGYIFVFQDIRGRHKSEGQFVMQRPPRDPKVDKNPHVGGFQLLIIGEPMRARFRKSFEKPEPVVPGEVNEYTIDLHWNHHCFQKGHKIMVQVQSSWFPLIDRNPQKYIDNIFEAKDEDFQSARQQVHRSPRYPSAIHMQVLEK